MRRSLLVLSAFMMGILGACAGHSDDCTDSQTCGIVDPDGGLETSVGSDSGDAGGDEADALIGMCDPNTDPKVGTDCVQDAYGLFVSPTGNDTNAGTKTAPFRTIGAAIAKSVVANRPRIYACAGAYAEHFTIDASHAVSLYGGFDCASCAYSGAHAKITGDVPGVVVTVRDVTTTVRLFDVDAEALAGTDALPSSVAAFVGGSADVVLRRVGFRARDGKEGAAGAAASTGVSTPADLSGSAAIGNTGAAEKTCTAPVRREASPAAARVAEAARESAAVILGKS